MSKLVADGYGLISLIVKIHAISQLIFVIDRYYGKEEKGMG